mmetsp:Transcript_29575/g.48800  ORF Transcript_29575/g.48800 Transcript_29575/m.48800 type:complete len:242 (+) Transcript_29575:146-871(+)|eukprot:CAMPEP_0119018152 /NCGR_PEP_ID=MMETSP1176-20130426/18732_1 /TAXON_ID=265551 /ORGANISM="Synedropsis recta cf, Strain CCMP1620" /LENGTH=241 /DNA_ID=CAMNT_0006972095 /DNA_START=70 /DNA_END=795 /DNA_ORIENTATION=-
MMPKPSNLRNSITLANISEGVSTQCIVPNNKDVLLGRGRTHLLHPGNVRFREIVGSKMHTYLKNDQRGHRSRLICEIADEILLTGARMLKRKKGTLLWYDAGIKAAREKVGHALRDASSNKSESINNIHLDLLRKKKEEESSSTTNKKRKNPVNLLSVIEATKTSLEHNPDCAGTVLLQAGIIFDDGLYDTILNLEPSTSPGCSSPDFSLDEYLEVVNDLELEDLEAYLAHALDCTKIQND